MWTNNFGRRLYTLRVNAETAMGTVSKKAWDFSKADSVYLLDGDRFIHEMYGHKGHVDGGFAVASLVRFPDRFVEASGPDSSGKTLVCLFAHHAFVVTKVREYLKLRAGTGVAAVGGSSRMNEGHREAWVRELSTWMCSRAAVWRPVTASA